MSNVLNRKTKQYLKSVNTPDYPITDWVINPILPSCIPKFWIIGVDTIREMTAAEKTELAYSTESNIYLITGKQLLTGKNGHNYESDSNTIINPMMPACALKYTKAVDGTVVEMTTEEKAIVDLPETERIESRTSLKEAYTNAISQLQTIQNTSVPTSAQVITAVKQITAIQEKLLNFIYRNNF